MAAQRGRDMLIKIARNETFETIAGLRSRRLAFNAETVDVTDGESVGRWRELLSGAGIQRASVSGAGIFKDQTSDALLRDYFFAAAIKYYQLVLPDFGTLVGPFQVAALEYRGEHNGEIAFDMALESAGAISFTGAG